MNKFWCTKVIYIYILGVVKRNPLFFHLISYKNNDFFLLHLIYIYMIFIFNDVCIQHLFTPPSYRNSLIKKIMYKSWHTFLNNISFIFRSDSVRSALRRKYVKENSRYFFEQMQHENDKNKSRVNKDDWKRSRILQWWFAYDKNSNMMQLMRDEE